LSNLALRFITGFTGAAILLAGIIYSEQTFLLLLIFISSMALLEFYRLCENNNQKPQKIFGLIINWIIFLPPLIQNMFETGFNILPLIIILPYIIFIRELFQKSSSPINNVGTTLLGILYISIPLFCFYLISFQGILENYQYRCILGFLFILWANDIGAYFAGTYLGKHKLFERISPKKTWEGFFGGVIFAFLISYIISKYFTNFNTMQWIVIASIIIIAGSLGDLVESMFKRNVQIKDSGSTLPGHGGFLDRFDGLFISAPFVFFYLQVWK
jgi:phosphatidate cytidylyltransferase